jgi:hypothetical protein
MKWRKLHALLSGSVLLANISPAAVSQNVERKYFDAYKLRVDAGFYYPTGSLHGASDTESIDLSKDLGFNSYPTFSGKVDWKFTRKNHLYVSIRGTRLPSLLD